MMPQDPELARVVHAETGEALDALLELSEAFISGSARAPEFVRSAFRIFHNVKGALRLAGFDAPELLAHAVEDRLSELRASGVAPSDEFIDVIEQAMSTCLKAVEAGGTHPDLNQVLERLARLADGSGDGAQTAGENRMNGGASGRPATLGPSPESSAALRGKALRIDAARLDRLMDLGSEYLAQHGRQRRQRTALREFSDRLMQLLKRDQRLRGALAPLAQDFEAFVRSEEQDLRRAGQLTADFDGAMRGVRMQPLATIVPQLRRVVSEAARELGKSAHLTVDFGDVEIDRQVLDALREPLMHLLRNAVDHGIEQEPVRLRRGKAARGEVRVGARVKGVNVEIEVSDDGGGIDLDKIRARGLEQGLLGTEEADDPARLLDATLFAPGFSTAASVTTVSGRGVGLDVVRARVIELGGQVYTTLGEASGGGASFTLSVPASVVSLRGLAVRAGGATFVLPSAQVERTLRLRASDLGSAEGVTVVRMPEGEPLRLRWLSSAMGLPHEDDPEYLQVAVVTEGVQRLGLVVDEVQGDTSFVIKRLPWNIRRAQGVIGATHQGDAALALVVDPTHLFRTQNTSTREHRVKQSAKKQRPRILVADDSLTSRTLERNILVSAGYDVKVAEDGELALQALEHHDFDLLVSDVQMPKMDGFELTRRVRSHPRLARLPIVLITSLDRPEDVAEGARVGADEYIVKGQFDQEVLLKTVSRLL